MLTLPFENRNDAGEIQESLKVEHDINIHKKINVNYE